MCLNSGLDLAVTQAIATLSLYNRRALRMSMDAKRQDRALAFRSRHRQGAAMYESGHLVGSHRVAIAGYYQLLELGIFSAVRRKDLLRKILSKCHR